MLAQVMEAGAEMIDDRLQRPEDLVADVVLTLDLRVSILAGEASAGRATLAPVGR